MLKKRPPQSETELITRVEAIAGYRLSDLARDYDFPVPDNLEHNKGWIGQLIEHVLGTDAGSKSEPDFVKLGIELKTIPIKKNMQPAETTYVCMVPLGNHNGLKWQDSCVAKKLRRVLWLPIESDPGIHLHQRKVGRGFLWRADAYTEAILEQDWEELMEMICLGEVESIDASYGEYLQIRPKGADSRARTQAINTQGKIIQTMPKGFYLRTRFTAKIIQDYLQKNAL